MFFNESVAFLAQVDFLTQKVFRSSAAAELGRPALAETASNSIAVPVLSLRSTGISSLLKLLLLKSTFARKPDRFIFKRKV
jgi:hypothetical protein